MVGAAGDDTRRDARPRPRARRGRAGSRGRLLVDRHGHDPRRLQAARSWRNRAVRPRPLRVIRPFQEEDAAGVAGLLRTALVTPWVVTERDVLHWQDVPARARRAVWVALEEGEVVGFA